MEQILNSIDCMFFTKDSKVLLLERQDEPYKNQLSLVGGVQNNFESFEAAIERILKQKLGIFSKVSNNVITINDDVSFNIEQVKSYDSGKDTRGGNVTTYAIETDLEEKDIRNFVTRDVTFLNVNKLPELAFEHNRFIQDYFFIKKDYTLTSNQNIGISVDTVILTVKDKLIKVLLAKRSKEPFKGLYTLPGGFIEKNISLNESALQILKRDTNITGAYLEQLYTFGDINRDSRVRALSVAYYALVDYSKFDVINSEKYEKIDWFSLSDLRKLDIAFDHREIINLALDRIQNKIEYTNIAFQLLPEKFTLGELQEVYETILDRELDKRNFRKKIAELDMLEELEEFKKQGRMRPARYHRFKERTKETPLRVKKWV